MKMKLIDRIFPFHPHVMKIYDMALGVNEVGTPVTAFRYRCALCGKLIDDITESGIRQLVEGHKKDRVFRWIREKKSCQE